MRQPWMHSKNKAIKTYVLSADNPKEWKRQMRRVHRLRKTVCVILCLVLASSSTLLVFADPETVKPIQKQETVFVTLSPDGNPTERIVSDWLHSDQKGVTINDKSTLRDIENVKSDEVPTQSGDNLTWKIKGNDIYYRGTSDKALPLDISVQYALNGKEMTPEEIAGKAGEVTIKVKLTNTQPHQVTIDGKEVTMYTPMTAVVAMALDNDTFTNVKASDGGTVVSEGNTNAVVFVGMPGLNESLNLKNIRIPELNDLDFPDELTVTAHTDKFSLGPIGIAASPELPNLDDLKKSKDFDEMRKNLLDLKTCQDDLDKIDPDRRIRSLITDAKKTANCQLLISDLFDFYDLDKAILNILPDYITEENIALYDKVKEDAEDSYVEDMLDNQTFRGIPDRLTDENIEKSKSLVKDYDDLKTFQMDKLDKVINVLNQYDQMTGLIDQASKLRDKASGKTNEKRLDTLDTLMSYSGDMLKIMDDMDDMGFFEMMDDDDKQMYQIFDQVVSQLTASKTEEITKLAQAVGTAIQTIAMGGPSPLDDATKAATIQIINAVAASGGLDEQTAQSLSGLVQQDFMNDPTTAQTYGPAVLQVIQAYGDALKEKTQDMASNLYKVLSQMDDINKGLKDDLGPTYQTDINGALHWGKDLYPDLHKLKVEADKNKDALDDAMDLVENKDDMRYMRDWAKKLKDMKKDMDNNSENLEILRDSLHEYDTNPKVRTFKHNFPLLQDDMDAVRPILDSLKEKLKDPVLNASLHKSPETTRELMRMKADLEANRDIAETLRIAVADPNVAMARNMINILDRLQSEDVINKYMGKLDDADDLFARKDAFVELSDQYKIYTEADQSADTSVKFVMKTDEIKAPVEKAPTPKKSNEKPSFFQWLKSIFYKVVGKSNH